MLPVLLGLEDHLDLLVRQAGKDLEELLVQLVQEDSQDSLGHQDQSEIRVPEGHVAGQVYIFFICILNRFLFSLL